MSKCGIRLIKQSVKQRKVPLFIKTFRVNFSIDINGVLPRKVAGNSINAIVAVCKI